MSAKTTLKWRAYPVRSEHAEALRCLTGRAFDADVPGRVGVAAADSTIELPEDLPDAPLDKAVTLLRAAAKVEHALMVQYLYASYSFAEPDRVLANVAIEEMSHLMTVQNLLRCLGQPPYLGRQDFRPPTQADERLFPFDLRLEPLSHKSLAKYVVAESPTSEAPDIEPDVLEHIEAVANKNETVNHVGILYALMAAVFGSEQLLQELAAEDDDPFYRTVEAMAATAALAYGGRDKLHLPDSAFSSPSLSEQASDDNWDRSVVGSLDEFRVWMVADRRKALEALRDIGLQGEGPSPVATEISHFRRFYDLFTTFFGESGMGTDPPAGVLNVPAGHRIVLDAGGSGPNVISHPTTIQWARLADLRYAILLGSLERYLRAPTGDRAFLRGWSFAEMFALKRLGVFLPTMPRNEQNATEVAAAPFNVPPWLDTGAQWSDIADAFAESITIATTLIGGGNLTTEQEQLLVLLLASDERKHAEATARTEGLTQRSRTDEVRDVLDWAAGAGNPTFGHGEHGRFWNLKHDDFIEVVIGGNIVTPPAGGGDATLVRRLKTNMPKDRPKLPLGSDELTVIEKWITDGRPP
jgi:hypothetical protein